MRADASCGDLRREGWADLGGSYVLSRDWVAPAGRKYSIYRFTTKPGPRAEILRHPMFVAIYGELQYARVGTL